MIEAWGYELAKQVSGQALFAIIRIPEREKLFKWGGPVFSEDDYFFQKRDAGLDIKTTADARKVARIAVRRDCYTYLELKADGTYDAIMKRNFSH